MAEVSSLGLGSPTPLPEVSEPGARVFIWAIWLMMLIGSLAFVLWYGPEVPLWDDFDVLPALVGEQPVTVGWLWSQHNEHRVPLPKLVLLGAYRISGWDFRAGMFFNALALGAAAAGLTAVVAAVRGGARYSDAFFSLALLNLGHHANLLWSWQVQLVLSTALASAILMLIAARASGPTALTATLLGACASLLPLCGANGLALVPALVVWLLANSVLQWRLGTPQGRRRSLAAFVAAVPAVLLGYLYFRGYRGSGQTLSGNRPGAVAETALQFLSLGFGPSGAILWPYSGCAFLLLLVLTVMFLIKALIREPDERPRALGLLCFLGGMGSLALGLGWGRAGAGSLPGLADRYVTLAVPALSAIMLAWQIYGGFGGSRLVPMSLFTAMCVLLWPNSQAGLERGRARHVAAEAFRQDLAAGMPLYKLIKRHSPFVHPSQDALEKDLPMLRRHGVRQFQRLRENPAFRQISVPTKPSEMVQAQWENGTFHITGPDAQLLFVLPEPHHVAGIRLRYSHSNRAGSFARFRLSWKHDGQTDFPPEQRYANWFGPTGPDCTTTIWVDDDVRQIRIQPDNQPCDFTVAEFTLLVP